MLKTSSSPGHKWWETGTMALKASIKSVNVKKLMQNSDVVFTKLNFKSGKYFVDLAVEMDLSYSLKLALWGLKHVGVTQR